MVASLRTTLDGSLDLLDLPIGDDRAIAPEVSVDINQVVDVDTAKAFQLVDRVLPFEACLYHQILPLSLEDGCLLLGMVTLEDTTALDYVRRLVSYMNYTLAPQAISSESHYSALSAYLSHLQSQTAGIQEKSPAAIPEAMPVIPPEVSQHFVKAIEDDFHSKATFMVDTPDELEGMPESAAISSTISESEDAAPSAPPIPEPPRFPGEALPILQVSAECLDRPIEELIELPPGQLLQELMGRILTGGIGRLYLERQSTSGRVIWSQNGALQSVIPELPLESFQGLIDELKLLTHLPLSAIDQVKQVEIERLCQNNRVLLRLRLMPTVHGEEATLQILRGAALKFYQRQQLTTLSRDALSIAKNLQQKLDEIRDRSKGVQEDAIDQATLKPALNEVLKIVEQQLNELKNLNEE